MASGTLPVPVAFRQGALDDPALARKAELRARSLERHPERVIHLVVVVGGVAGDVVAEVEADGLEDAPALAAVPVLDLAEALDDAGLHPGLLPPLRPRR